MTPEGCISQSGPPPLLGHTGAVRSGAVEVVAAKAGAGARCGRLCRLVPHGATQVPDPASSRMESIPLPFPRSCQDFVVDLTLEHLAGQGASTVALVSDDTASSTGRSRFDAFWLTVSRVPGLEMGVALLGSFSIDFGTKAARELLRHSRLPDAVVCGSDLVALGVVREFRQSGIAIPDTVKVTGFDGILFGELCDPPLTTVLQPVQAIAAEAVRLLQSRMRGDRAAARRMEIAPSLIVRRSSMAAQA